VGNVIRSAVDAVHDASTELAVSLQPPQGFERKIGEAGFDVVVVKVSEDSVQVTSFVGNVIRSAVDAVHDASTELAVSLQPPQGFERKIGEAGFDVLVVARVDDSVQVTSFVGNVKRSAVDAVHDASRELSLLALLSPSTACDESHTYHPTKFQESRVPFGLWFSLCERLQHCGRHAGELRTQV